MPSLEAVSQHVISTLSVLTIRSGITFGTLYINSNWSWRLPSLLQSAPSFVQLLLVLLLPESPRWLVSRGKDEKALEILAKYHANGDREDPLVRFEYAEMKVSIRQGEQKGRWSELFKTREYSLSLPRMLLATRSDELDIHQVAIVTVFSSVSAVASSLSSPARV